MHSRWHSGTTAATRARRIVTSLTSPALPLSLCSLSPFGSLLPTPYLPPPSPHPVDAVQDNSESISAFKERGSKLVMWHGWSDNIIMPQGTIDFYNAVVNTVDGGDVTKTQEWMRLFMAPGVSHCGMDTGVFFDALVAWVEKVR